MSFTSSSLKSTFMPSMIALRYCIPPWDRAVVYSTLSEASELVSTLRTIGSLSE